MQNENLKKNSTKRKILDLDTKKEIAKIGMTASLITLVATSFSLKSRTSKLLHVGSGATLLGFSLWHHMLYQPEKKQNKPKNSDDKSDK